MAAKFPRTGALYLAALLALPAPSVAEIHLDEFVFECRTPLGTLTPEDGKFGYVYLSEVEGTTDDCLSGIKGFIAQCRENALSLSRAEHDGLDDDTEMRCHSTFEDQRRSCVMHFSRQRFKCAAPARETGAAERERIRRDEREAERRRVRLQRLRHATQRDILLDREREDERWDTEQRQALREREREDKRWDIEQRQALREREREDERWDAERRRVARERERERREEERKDAEQRQALREREQEAEGRQSTIEPECHLQQVVADAKRQHDQREGERRRKWVADSESCDDDRYPPGVGSAYIRRMLLGRPDVDRSRCRESVLATAGDFYSQCSFRKRECNATGGKFTYDLNVDWTFGACAHTWSMTPRCNPYKPWKFTPPSGCGGAGSVQ